MPVQFKYQAISKDGHSQSGVISAERQSQVEELLAERSLLPISIAPQKSGARFSLTNLFKGSDFENLIMFTNSLSTLYKAGIPILTAFSIMKIGPPNGQFNYAIGEIRSALEAGKSISEALAQHPKIFKRVYCASVAAGEESGHLGEVLDELAIMLENEMELTREIRSGIRYPMMVIGVIGVAFLVMVTYVMPRFVSFYGSFGSELPLPTRILLGTQQIIAAYWPLFLILLGLLVYGFKRLIGNPKGKLWLDRMVLKIPVIGGLITKGNVARFVVMFRLMFKSGLPLVQSLRVLADSVDNSMIKLEINKLESLFRSGEESRLSGAEFEFLPDMALQMISIGLESGSLDDMLDEIGRHYSREVHYTSRHLTSILEPLLTLVLGVFVLILALAIFLPMWNLIEVFKGGV